MSGIKPVSFVSDSALKELNHPCMVACCPYETAAMKNALYTIPDTHRVVSVELLERILPIIPDDPYCNGIYSVLCAIIDNKE